MKQPWCRCIAFLLLPLGLIGCVSVPNSPTTQPSAISLQDLRSRPVIGELGQPLGKCFDIEGTVYLGSDLHDKGAEGRYLIRVTTVNGKPLDKPVLMKFAVPGFVQSSLASNDFALYEKQSGQPAHNLASDEVTAMRKGYVGKTVRATVYEVGEFSGIPSGMPSNAPVWQDRFFWFQTWLVILVDRS